MTAEEHPTRSRFARRKRAATAQVVADTHALAAWWETEQAEARAYDAERRFWQTASWCIAVLTGVIVGGTAYVLLVRV